MDLYLSPDHRRRGLARGIYEQIRDAIAVGRVRPGATLPPSRELARELGVSRFTVTTAYGYLVSEGFLEGAGAAGTRVREAPPPSWRVARFGRGVTPHKALAADVPAAPRAKFDLRLGTPDAALFPYGEFRRQLGRAQRELRGVGAAYASAAGDPVLRAAVAAFIHRSRGVHASADQIVVTAGAQQAFDLILGALTQPGDVVAVEDPGYLPFRELARLRGVKLAPVPVDAEGLVASALPRTAKLIYVTPSHQFPLGAALSLPRRRQLIEWARATGAAIIEDDYDSEFRFNERPLEPLYRLEGGARVLYVGSFSKTLSPALRLGFLVAPREWVSSVARLRQLVDWGSPTLLSRALGRFVADGELDRHLRRARREYRERHDLIADWLSGRGRRLGRALAVGAGLHVALELDRRDEAAILARAERAGLAIDGLSKYGQVSVRPGLGLGYGSASTRQLEEALRILSRL
jgi:GntR family transcriptional regulator/MocR family aminotransferase